jgi:hypothetical protein
MLNGHLQVESNVTRIARAILPESEDGIQQIVYYGKGVASQGGFVDRVVMGKFTFLPPVSYAVPGIMLGMTEAFRSPDFSVIGLSLSTLLLTSPRRHWRGPQPKYSRGVFLPLQQLQSR